MNEENAVSAGSAEPSVDDLMKAHMERWQKRAQIVVAVIAAFLLYMVWFMMHP